MKPKMKPQLIQNSDFITLMIQKNLFRYFLRTILVPVFLSAFLILAFSSNLYADDDNKFGGGGFGSFGGGYNQGYGGGYNQGFGAFGGGYGGGYENEGGEALGSITLWSFLILNSLYFYSMMFRALPKELKQTELFRFPIRLKVMIRNYHYWGNPVVVGIAYVHGIWSSGGNILLWGGWGIMVLLSLSGMLLKLQRADQPGAKFNRLLHSQHALSVIMLVMLLIGHGFSD